MRGRKNLNTRRTRGDPLDLFHRNPTPGRLQQFIDNLEMDALEEEAASYWDAPEFLKILNDPEFMLQVHNICTSVSSSFKPSPAYTSDDLEQDVLIRYCRWLPKYRGEAQLATVLRRIAINQLIDLSRRRDNQCPSYGDIETACQALMAHHAKTRPNKNHVEAAEERKLLAQELTCGLTAMQQSMLEDYFERGLTMQEMADARGVSRQAMSEQLIRLLKKLRSSLERHVPPGGGAVAVGVGNGPSI